jgi:hypothetical protein
MRVAMRKETVKKILLVLTLILTASLVGQVEHAPTVAQCQADQRLWLAKLEEGDSPRLPKYDVLLEWDREMTDCRTIDPNNKWLYYNTSAEASNIILARLVDFARRRGLWTQFEAEDEAGKR